MKEEAVKRLRQFNRFYLPAMDLLNKNYVGTEFPLPEARVLYEISIADGCTAAAIGKRMNLDKSYLSRIIKSHEKAGYLTRTVSPQDGRAYELHLTEAGRRHADVFNERSDAQLADLIASLDEVDCCRLMAALDTVTELLGGMSTVTLL